MGVCATPQRAQRVAKGREKRGRLIAVSVDAACGDSLCLLQGFSRAYSPGGDVRRSVIGPHASWLHRVAVLGCGLGRDEAAAKRPTRLDGGLSGLDGQGHGIHGAGQDRRRHLRPSGGRVHTGVRTALFRGARRWVGEVFHPRGVADLVEQLHGVRPPGGGFGSKKGLRSRGRCGAEVPRRLSNGQSVHMYNS